MKFNKWTMGLAALGAVSLASVAKAEEKMSFVQTATSGTTISGYVDTSVEWAVNPNHSTFVGGLGGLSSPGNGFNSVATGIPFRANKQNGFNLNVVELNISKPLDETPWASGYNVSLLFGPDAVGYNPSANGAGGQFVGGTSADFAIKDANVVLRAPIGNGLEIKIGVFDTVIGYEVFEAGSNPNFTRSWGYAMEPTQHTGLLFTYHVNDNISVSAGIANTLSPGINSRNTSNGTQNYWEKTALASITLTAPQSWGWAAGATFSAGMVYGFDAGVSDDRLNVYAGITVPTPIKGLAFGAAFDYTQFDHKYSEVSGFDNNSDCCCCGYMTTPLGSGSGDYINNFYSGKESVEAYSFALYATWQATEKLSLNLRGEYVHGSATDKGGNFEDYYYNCSFDRSDFISYSDHANVDVFAVTGTLQYNLWANVISRLEVRYDTACFSQRSSGFNFETDEPFHSSNHGSQDQLSLYLNIIYKF